MRRFRPDMGVVAQHFPIVLASYERDLFDGEAHFEEAACALVSQIVQMQVLQASQPVCKGQWFYERSDTRIYEFAINESASWCSFVSAAASMRGPLESVICTPFQSVMMPPAPSMIGLKGAKS